MEKYMCSRFFIDFPDISAQEGKLCAYLDNHFGAEFEVFLKYILWLLVENFDQILCEFNQICRLKVNIKIFLISKMLINKNQSYNWSIWSNIKKKKKTIL